VNPLVTAFRQKFKPLEQLLIIGFLVRLISVIFSKGFGWHDDHFLIIEASQSWVDGYDYNDWLPTPEVPDRKPSGHSLFYTGIHYFIFKFLTSCGITDPQAKMYFVRFLHALWSLLVIKYGYKIAEQYGNQKVAWYTGIFLSLYWFMPFISVRNLVEFVCVPPILIAIYKLGKKEFSAKNIFIAGLWLGIAFSIRFQSIFISAGIGFALILQKTSFKNIFLFALTYLATIFLIQGGIDLVIWKRPFAEFMGYVDYNLNNSDQYGTDNWHMYFDLIFGLLIPPLSIVLFAGYFYTWKKIPLIFWPVFLFLAFHTYFPNKQERFIMTVLPLIVIAGTVGMFLLYERFESRINKKLLRGCKVFVIVINLILLPVLAASYSKRHRVEAMTYLFKKHHSAEFIVEDSNHSEFLMPPLYYYGRWIKVQGVTQDVSLQDVRKYYEIRPERDKPQFIIFWEAENLPARIDSVKKYYPELTYETTIEPSFIDKTVYWLNPLNSNQTTYIYRLQKGD
jgi:hypothetical protein